MKEAYAAVRGAGTGRLTIGVAGLVLGCIGLWQFVAHVPMSGWVRVLVWLGAGIVVHDGLLAPMGVVSGWVVARRVPDRARPVVRFTGLAALTVVLLVVPLLATGGVRH